MQIVFRIHRMAHYTKKRTNMIDDLDQLNF